MTRFLQDYAAFVKSQERTGKVPRVYAMVNCGFPEDEINGEALRVVESFSRSIGARYRFGLMIGGEQLSVISLMGFLVLMGSGETTPTMTSTHRKVAQRLERPRCVMLDTPFGFQENADQIVEKTAEYFLHSVGQELGLASYRSSEAGAKRPASTGGWITVAWRP